MFARHHFHKDESGQTALETAIILIAFVVVASVFAFTILSAGSSSTERGEEAIYAGLEGVQSSMEVKGAVLAEGAPSSPPVATDPINTLIFRVALVAGGDPVDLTSNDADADGTADNPALNVVNVGYRDASQIVNDLVWTVTWIGANDGDNMLETGELAEITVALGGLTNPLIASTDFTIEIVPPSGAVLAMNRTAPAAVEAVMELR
ncbi:hypothetical protein HC928_15995 [bacterium]|nr:hypothetical protein [bacterium]